MFHQKRATLFIFGVAAERARPYLTTQDSGDSNDYINAVFIDVRFLGLFLNAFQAHTYISKKFSQKKILKML